MNALIFASNNQHKVDEIKLVLGNGFKVSSLQDEGIDIDIPEPHDTLEENAREKSITIYRLTGKNCFSEDTGLEVDALGGAPGVKSARYAGDNRSFGDNIDKLLQNLIPISNRTARFRTVISLILEGKETQFEGICEGRIIKEQRGNNGFGYDSVFIPGGSTLTFAEMEKSQKVQYSHRTKAISKLVSFLQDHP